ncbi:MAG TPA: thiamine pyrophosphate-dependent enzyme, partial [Steroidobacteraceae bacterium]|nr:thiamine pyrophosphate-dependent enzyme [Steroidobacteraceae bacterium]
PITRLKQHLIALGEWSDERHARLEKELEAHVTACWKEAESYGTLTGGPALDPLTMFEDVFKEMPPNLQAQQRELRALREAQGEARTAPAPPAASQAGKG